MILLSGLPGTGKSTFAAWLAEQRGYFLIETDREPGWYAHLAVSDADGAAATVASIRACGDDVVVEWGFLPKYLDSVRLLRDAGVEAWWFSGDEAATRDAFIRRTGGTESVMRVYEAQLDRIRGATSAIEHFYGGRIIHSVTAGPNFMSPEEIADVMLRTSPHDH